MKHIYAVNTRIFKQGDECNELNEYYSSMKKAKDALRLLNCIYDKPSADRFEEPAYRADQCSPTIFFNARSESDEVRFRTIRILKLEVL